MIRLITPVFAQTKSWADVETSIGNNLKCSENNVATLQGFECIFANILSIIIPLAGLAAFVTLIIGGFQYLTSGGDPKQTQKAQSVITAAIIGIVVILGLWFVFRLLYTITGLNLLQFEIPKSP